MPDEPTQQPNMKLVHDHLNIYILMINCQINICGQ